MDKIKIKGLEIFAHHGVFEEENVLGQKFVINAELMLSTRQAGLADDIKQSVDYGAVCALLGEVMQRENFNLIETAAEKMASEVLLRYPLIEEIELELQKPWAPILMPVETVSVTISRKRHKVYLGLGSNLGDKEAYLDFAIDELNKDQYTKVTKVSDFIETEPYGNVEQDNFLNGCVEVETLHTPVELLELVNGIEAAAGRKRLVHWGPRTLDIDILLFDDICYDDDKLHIPHKEMTKRAFVLEPLSSIAAFVKHPVYGKTVEELWQALAAEDNRK